MKSVKQMLLAATMVALGGLYGCGDGDSNDVTVCDSPGSCPSDSSSNTNNTGGGNGGGQNPGTTGTTSENCPAWSSARQRDADGNDVCQLPAEILQSRTLTNDIVWFMAGRVTVGNGNKEMSVVEGVLENGSDVADVTLTINEGTEIKAATGTFANLLITRGSKINAVGTVDEPIIFSSDDEGFDGSSEWGGIIIHGYGLHNECLMADMGVVACNVDSEGESGFGGGYTVDDNSGRMSYVIVTEGGYEFAPGNEINGISLIGVGSDTVLDHLQVNDNSDDGIEFYGGNVDVKYLVLTGNKDDSVDWDEGFQGNLQYVLVIQNDATEGNGIEADTEGTTDFYSKPTIANATFIVDGSNDEALVFKASSGGFLLNSVVTIAAGNASIVNCVNVDGAGAEANLPNAAGRLAFNNVIVDCPNFGTDPGDAPLGAVGNVQAVDPNLDANYAAQAPEASGVAIDVATFNATYAESTADNAYLDNTTFSGAVDPSGSDIWYAGWTLEGTL